MDVCILTATTNGEQQTFRLADGEVATFGRSSTCDFRVADAKVSRQHCLLGFRGGQVEVSDLGSSNDLKHRGERKSHFLLAPGDGFHAGKTYVTFVGIEPRTASARKEPELRGDGAVVPDSRVPQVVAEEDGAAPAEPLACAPFRQLPYPDEPGIGDLVGNYRLVSLLGRSDRGTAFVAEHVQLQRRVAIKWLRKDSDAQAVSTFLADMKRAAAVASPWLLSVYDVEPDGDTRYAAMELAAGRSIASRLESGPRISWEEAMGAVADVLRALSVLHASQQTHGGVKPENVFLLERGGARLGDIRSDAGLRPLEHVACAAPELIQRGVASVRSDLHAVGAVAFAAITGGLALADNRGRRRDVANLLARDASLPTGIVEWISDMVSEDPAYRPASADAALEALLAIRGESRPRPALELPRAKAPAVASRAEPTEPSQKNLPRVAAPQRPQASPAKVFFARLTGELIVFSIILACGIALLLVLKIKFPDFDIYRLIGRDK